MPRFLDDALCVRELDWSETSQLVVLLTREHGLIRGLAKGSKRMGPSSIAKFSGGIELLTLGRVCGITRAGQELATLTEWDLAEDFFHLRTRLSAQRYALAAADLCAALLADHDPHPEVFAALHALLGALATSEAAAEARAFLRFQWLLLTACGYRPHLYDDARGGEPLPESDTYGFDPAAGGLTHQSVPPEWRVRHQTVTVLRQMDADIAAPQQPTEQVNAASLQRANRLLCAYARTLLDRELPSMRWILSNAAH